MSARRSGSRRPRSNVSDPNQPRRGADGTPHWLGMAEQATCAAALFCTPAEVLEQQLTGAHFLLRGCGQAWDATLEVALEGETLSQITVGARLASEALPELQRWVGEWWLYCHPEGLRAHAALVRREGERRRRLRGLSLEAARVGRGERDARGAQRFDALGRDALGAGGVVVDFVE